MILDSRFGSGIRSQKTSFFDCPFLLQMGLMAIIFLLIIGLQVGIISGMCPETGIDHSLRSFRFSVSYVPEFSLGFFLDIVMNGVKMFGDALQDRLSPELHGVGRLDDVSPKAFGGITNRIAVRKK